MSKTNNRFKVYIARGSGGKRLPTIEVEVEELPNGTLRFNASSDILNSILDNELKHVKRLKAIDLPHYNGIRISPVVVATSEAMAEYEMKKRISEEISQLIDIINLIRGYVEQSSPSIIRDILKSQAITDADVIKYEDD